MLMGRGMAFSPDESVHASLRQRPFARMPGLESQNGSTGRKAGIGSGSSPSTLPNVQSEGVATGSESLYTRFELPLWEALDKEGPLLFT